MTLVSDANKKNSLAYDSHYRLYKWINKLLGLMIWLVPLMIIIVKVGGHLFGGTHMQDYEEFALVIICVGYAVILAAAKLLFRFFVNLLTGGFTQENVNERITITQEGTIVYFHDAKKGKHLIEERIFPSRVVTDEASYCVMFWGRIEKYQIEPNGEKVRKQGRSKLTLYDYYSPSLIQALKQFQV